MTTYIPLEEHAEEYRQTGRWMMDRAKWEFAQGDLIQASEKGWNAAAQSLKALAIQRGWGHESHTHLGQVADKLAVETGNKEISALFDRAESLHANFYEAHRSEEEVRWGLDDIQRYLDILEAIPPPETPPRKGYVRDATSTEPDPSSPRATNIICVYGRTQPNRMTIGVHHVH